MDVTDVAALAERSTDRFRLETQPTYQVPQEAADFAAWQRGDRTLPTPVTHSWLAHLRDTTAAGVRWSRVRVLDYPLTDYARFELHGYQANQRAGERIYVVDRNWSPELAELHDDAWFFDHTTIVRMLYDEHGKFTGAEQSTDLTRFNGMRAAALRYALPLDEFLTAYEPRLVA